METYLGTIQLFGFSYAPPGWSQCQGQLLNLAQNTALYSLLGVAFGGNGSSTFGLPDLRGRTVMGAGQHPGGASYTMGQVGGAENVTLQSANLPPHSHVLNGSSAQATQASPGGSVLSTANGTDSTGGSCGIQIYGPAGTASPLDPSSIGSTGSGQGFGILSPFQVVNACIAIQGIYPSRQ